MLTYVISRASFSETPKMQPSFFCWSLAKRGIPGVPNGDHGNWV